MVANKAIAIKITAIVFRRRRVNGDTADTLAEPYTESGSHVLHGSLYFVEVPDALTL